jgi:hypothetical protein
LNIKANSNFFKTSLCFAWTSGITDVSVSNQYITCDKGAWRNYSSYDAKTFKYKWLEIDTYLCGDEKDGDYEKCDLVVGNKCKTINEITPEFLIGKVDSCYYLGKDLKDENYSIDLNVRSSEFKNSWDKITIYVYDKDRRYNLDNKLWEWESSENGNDIGAENKNITLYYDCSGDYCKY